LTTIRAFRQKSLYNKQLASRSPTNESGDRQDEGEKIVEMLYLASVEFVSLCLRAGPAQ
jgi:hypothetical protein